MSSPVLESYYINAAPSSNENQLPIATLPMLNGKMYAIWSPALIQAALRSKTLRFDPFIVEFTQPFLGLSDEAFRPGLGPRERESLLPARMTGLHQAMQPEHLHRMNAAALNYIAESLNAVDAPIQIPNLYLWLRDLMTFATTEALYGSENPLRGRKDLVEDLW